MTSNRKRRTAIVSAALVAAAGVVCASGGGLADDLTPALSSPLHHDAFAAAAGLAPAKAAKDRRPNLWRIVFANDVFFGSDNQFTNGFTVEIHSPFFDNLDDVRGGPAWGKRIARGVLPQREGLRYRKGFVVGQNMQTPTDITNPNIILDDVPYLGMLAVASSWIALDDMHFTGFELLFGLVGEDSGAEEVQKAIHALIDSDDPQGWEFQLDTEPVVQFIWMKKRKLWNLDHFDGAVTADVKAGNFIAGAEGGLEMRFGTRLPTGFVYIPDVFGSNINYAADVLDEIGRFSVVGSVTLRAKAVGYSMARDGNVLVDGNEWTDNNTIEPANYIGQAILGLTLARPRWALRFSLWFTTDTIDPASIGRKEDPESNFGVISFEWRR